MKTWDGYDTSWSALLHRMMSMLSHFWRHYFPAVIAVVGTVSLLSVLAFFGIRDLHHSEEFKEQVENIMLYAYEKPERLVSVPEEQVIHGSRIHCFVGHDGLHLTLFNISHEEYSDIKKFSNTKNPKAVISEEDETASLPLSIFIPVSRY